MKMNPTPTATAITGYPAYVHNCLRNAQCEPPYLAPLPGLPYLQLYVDFGAYAPLTFEIWLRDVCANTSTQIFPSNYVVGQTPDGNWYGVFKYFHDPGGNLTSFVAWLSTFVDAPGGPIEKTFFSEMLVVEPCAQLTKVKACQPEGATTTGFDFNGLYYGLPVNVDYLGLSGVRYFHIAYVRLGKVRQLAVKGTFKSSLVTNFRTTIEKTFQLETELVPKWYADVLLAIYARGAVQVNDEPIKVVSDLNFEALNDDDLTWKPFVQLKETVRLYFGCDASDCVECCSPQVINAATSSCRIIRLVAIGGDPTAVYIGCDGLRYHTDISTEGTTICTDGTGYTVEGGIVGETQNDLGTCENDGTGSVPDDSPSDSSSTSESAGPEILSGPFKLGTTSENVCDPGITTLYWAGPGGALVPGNILYTNNTLTTPVTGFNFVSDSVGTEIFNINSANGTVGATTGTGC